ncbi:MAG: T9SS type A sorting domain-containing protein [Bacteroidia bacterium]
MKKTFIFLLTLLSFLGATAQTNTYVINGMACNNDTLDFSNPNVYHYPQVGDDVTKPAVQIGFPFCYFGTMFDSVSIGSNGCIWMGVHAGFKSFSIPPFGQTQQLMNLKPNCILSNYQDMNPSTCAPGKGVSYSRDGFAPNRTFTIEYKEIRQFGYVGDSTFSSKVVLHENTNEIDIHIINHPNLDSFSTVNAVMGLVPGATSGYLPIIPTGYWGLWNASNVAFRFIPVGDCSLAGAYNSISGKVYYDENRNCLFDNLDYKMQGELIVANGGNSYTFTDALGNYVLLLGAGTHTVEHIPAFTHNNYCPTTPYSINFTGLGSNSINNDFADSSANCVDLYVDIGTGFQRLCRTNNLSVTYGNAGTITSMPSNIVVTLPANTIYVSSNPAPANINGNILTYNIPALQPNQSGSILIQDSILCDTTLMGNVLTFAAEILSPDDECDNNNIPNSNVDPATVMNAWDPNDCRVLSQLPLQNGYVIYEDIEADDILTYMIRFQNTGNDTAFNITVHDLLPTYLNAATVVAGASSHPYQFVRYGNDLRFIFNNIMLPDSNASEPASHGFVKFTVHQILGNSVGTTIPNHADIFFDFNPAVVTNVANVHIPEFIAIDETSEAFLKVYPNPASDKVTIELKKTGTLLSQIEVLDLTGKSLQLHKLQASATELSLKQLPVGVYFLRCKDSQGIVYTYKVMVN